MKTLFLLLVIYLAYVVLKGFFFRGRLKSAGRGGGYSGEGMPPPSGRTGPVPEDDAEVTVQDPVCGSFVPVSAAESLNTPQGVVYFCSTECREKFIEESGR